MKVIGSGRVPHPAAVQGRDITTIPVLMELQNRRIKWQARGQKISTLLRVHDCFTIAEVTDVEDLGFFKKERGCKEGATRRDGRIPINPSGGLKSKGHPIGATGIGQVVEVFEQFTGAAGDRTVKDAEIALTHNFGATGASAAVHIFQKV
jgi:acetyl-CoA C-acetyltransferase